MFNQKNMPLNNFHLGDHHTHRSGGIRLLMNNTLEALNEKQRKVLLILEKYSGINIIDDPESPQVDLSQVKNSNFNRVMALLQMNSSLIDALHYSKGEITREWKKISDISNTILRLKIELRDYNKVDTYNFVDITIGEIIYNIIYDIRSGQYKPTEEELGELKELEQVRASFLKKLNQNKIITIGARS